jgi:hypothetical protein
LAQNKTKKKIFAHMRLHTAVDPDTHKNILEYCEQVGWTVSMFLRYSINQFISLPRDLLEIKKGPKIKKNHLAGKLTCEQNYKARFSVFPGFSSSSSIL